MAKMSDFESAFAAARKAQGRGGKFTFKGESYTTDYAGEKPPPPRPAGLTRQSKPPPPRPAGLTRQSTAPPPRPAGLTRQSTAPPPRPRCR